MAVFDAGTVERLADDAGDRAFALGLLETYVRLLGRRVARIVDATSSADADRSLDAVLSLKVSSTMVGAEELADLAAVVERHLRGRDLAAARTHALLLAPAAERGHAALASFLYTDSIR